MTYDLLGTPSEDEVAHIKNRRACAFLKEREGKKGADWNQMFAGRSEAAVDLVKKLLVFDPKKRLTAAEALTHPFFATVREKIRAGHLSHLKCDNVRPRADVSFDFDKGRGSSNKDMRRLLRQEVRLFSDTPSEREQEIRSKLRSIVNETRKSDTLGQENTKINPTETVEKPRVARTKKHRAKTDVHKENQLHSNNKDNKIIHKIAVISHKLRHHRAVLTEQR
eukprot:CAMPEP_0172520710 /NCGR_PEP_ID=MMETSP1066-20121228/292165_1 /TAXON_ID=671091 /ORGANISM="Coscinodiscus wailesii, Strain CCMP2513" /LENGTH=222 /DNA_ID=CAMNT_0013303515 /DNA_START=642 /DNA_END=1307 /DNA_ORIENTATION=+